MRGGGPDRSWTRCLVVAAAASLLVASVAAPAAAQPVATGQGEARSRAGVLLAPQDLRVLPPDTSLPGVGARLSWTVPVDPVGVRPDAYLVERQRVGERVWTRVRVGVRCTGGGTCATGEIPVSARALRYRVVSLLGTSWRSPAPSPVRLSASLVPEGVSVSGGGVRNGVVRIPVRPVTSSPGARGVVPGRRVVAQGLGAGGSRGGMVAALGVTRPRPTPTGSARPRVSSRSPSSAAASSSATAPVPSGPVPSARVSSGPVSGARVSSGPVSSGRASGGPVSSGPVSSAPVRRATPRPVPSVTSGVSVPALSPASALARADGAGIALPRGDASWRAGAQGCPVPAVRVRVTVPAVPGGGGAVAPRTAAAAPRGTGGAAHPVLRVHVVHRFPGVVPRVAGTGVAVPAVPAPAVLASTDGRTWRGADRVVRGLTGGGGTAVSSLGFGGVRWDTHLPRTLHVCLAQTARGAAGLVVDQVRVDVGA